MSEQADLNTDRELFREPKGDLPSDYYANSLHVTAQGHVGMNVGGTVYVLPIHDWHALAAAHHNPPPRTAPGQDSPMRPRRASTSGAGSPLVRAYVYFGVPIFAVAFVVGLVRFA